MKKLYEVTVEHTVYVMAEDDNEAKWEAELALDDSRYDIQPDSVIASRVKSYIDKEWRDGQPYNQDADDERTCAEILEDERIRALRDAEPCLPGMESR